MQAQITMVYFRKKRKLSLGFRTFTVGVIPFDVNHPMIQHLLTPKLKGLHSNRNPLQLLLNMDKVLQLVIRDFAIGCNFNQTVLLLVHGVQ